MGVGEIPSGAATRPDTAVETGEERVFRAGKLPPMPIRKFP